METIFTGDSLSILKRLPFKSVQTCVTSPPYFGLRDYGMTGQIGLEDTPDAYVRKLVELFREVRRVLRPDGTLWLNLGDSYNGSGKGGDKIGREGKQSSNRGTVGIAGRSTRLTSLKAKDLIGIPWRVAFALQADGWYLRQDIIWHKPNPMPESVTDRCTKAHEYIFLFSKSSGYYFDGDAIKAPVASSSIIRLLQPNLPNQRGSDRVPGKINGPMKAVLKGFDHRQGGGGSGFKGHSGNRKADGTVYLTRNKRSVWTVTTRPYKGVHFATFPPTLIEPCILAGAPMNGVVLDPFLGSGTTAAVAKSLGRGYVGIELNPRYVKLAEARLAAVGEPR